MSAEGTEKAREQARRVLGRNEDESTEYKGLPPSRRAPPASSGIGWEPAGESMLVLALGEAARALGVSDSELQRIVETGELATVPVGDFGGRMVPRAEVERIKAKRDR